MKENTASILEELDMDIEKDREERVQWIYSSRDNKELEARKKNAYREFHQMVMGEPLNYATDSFDAVISVGVLTVGHAPASSFDELIRITKPGGYIVFSLRPDVYRDSGFKEKQDALESEGKWKLVEVSEEFQPLPKGEPDVYHQVWVYQVVSS